MPATLYDLLGVAPTASTDEIRQAYRRLALSLHPDTNPAPEAQQTFQHITAAYNVLTDPARRAAYDASLRPKTITIVNIFVNRPAKPVSGVKRTKFHAKGRRTFRPKPQRFHAKEPTWRPKRPNESFRQRYGGLLVVGGVVLVVSLTFWFLMGRWIAPAPTLDLSMRSIRTWPEAVNSPVVERLYLNDNYLRTIPPSIKGARNLIYLDLARNQIESLPQQLFDLPYLHGLSLTGNRLTQLGPAFAEMTPLKILDVSNNRITSISPHIRKLNGKLLRLDVRGNPLPPALQDSLRLWLPAVTIRF